MKDAAMKNNLKALVICGLLFASSSKLFCMQQIPVLSLIEAESVFIETESTRIKLAFIGKARAAEKAWQKAFEASRVANQAWKDAFIGDKEELSTFEELDLMAENADELRESAVIKANRVTAEARQLYREAKGLGAMGISISWTKVKAAEALYLRSLCEKTLFTRMY